MTTNIAALDTFLRSSACFSIAAAFRKQIEYGVYGDLILIYPKPYSSYLTGHYSHDRPVSLSSSTEDSQLEVSPPPYPNG